MSAQCSLCRQRYEDKEITHLAAVPVEWDEGLTKQWQFACFKHEGVEEHFDDEATERFHTDYIEDYDPLARVRTGWRGSV